MSSQFERELVKESPLVWFELHGHVRGKMRKIIKFPDLRANKMQRQIDQIREICDRDNMPCRIITLKGRQQGSSSWSMAAAYHYCRNRGVKALVIGDEYEKSVKNLVDMFELYASKDTFPWGSTYHPPSKKFSNDSELGTETANDNRAAASGTYQVIIMTEVAWWKETQNTSAANTFAAALSCVPMEPGTLVIVESTPNGVGGAYYDTYQGAISLEDYEAGKIPSGWNGFFKVFYAWHDHPEYGGELYQEITNKERKAITDSLTDKEQEFLTRGFVSGDPLKRLHWRRKILNSAAFNKDEEKFEQEYPFDEDSGFLMSGRRAFNLPKIQSMRRHAKDNFSVDLGMLEWSNPERTKAAFRICPEDEAILRVWEKPRPGFRYLLSVDPCTGASQTVGEDPDNHAAGIIRAGCFHAGRWMPPALVARLADCFAEKRHPKSGLVCRWDIDVLEQRLAQLSYYYGGCPVVPEINMDRGLIELMKQRGGIDIYQRVVFNRVEQKDTNQYGWKTDQSTRPVILEALAAAVRKFGEEGDGIDIKDQAVIREMETCIVKLNGRVEAMAGCHDDSVLMIAIGLATLGQAKMMPQEQRYRFNDDDDHYQGDPTFQ